MPVHRVPLPSSVMFFCPKVGAGADAGVGVGVGVVTTAGGEGERASESVVAGNTVGPVG